MNSNPLFAKLAISPELYIDALETVWDTTEAQVINGQVEPAELRYPVWAHDVVSAVTGSKMLLSGNPLADVTDSLYAEANLRLTAACEAGITPPTWVEAAVSAFEAHKSKYDVTFASEESAVIEEAWRLGREALSFEAFIGRRVKVSKDDLPLPALRRITGVISARPEFLGGYPEYYLYPFGGVIAFNSMNDQAWRLSTNGTICEGYLRYVEQGLYLEQYEEDD